MRKALLLTQCLLLSSWGFQFNARSTSLSSTNASKNLFGERPSCADLGKGMSDELEKCHVCVSGKGKAWFRDIYHDCVYDFQHNRCRSNKTAHKVIAPELVRQPADCYMRTLPRICVNIDVSSKEAAERSCEQDYDLTVGSAKPLKAAICPRLAQLKYQVMEHKKDLGDPLVCWRAAYAWIDETFIKADNSERENGFTIGIEMEASHITVKPTTESFKLGYDMCVLQNNVAGQPTKSMIHLDGNDYKANEAHIEWKTTPIHYSDNERVHTAINALDQTIMGLQQEKASGNHQKISVDSMMNEYNTLLQHGTLTLGRQTEPATDFEVSKSDLTKNLGFDISVRDAGKGTYSVQVNYALPVAAMVSDKYPSDLITINADTCEKRPLLDDVKKIALRIHQKSKLHATENVKGLIALLTLYMIGGGRSGFLRQKNPSMGAGVLKSKYENLPKTPVRDVLVLMTPAEKLVVWFFVDDPSTRRLFIEEITEVYPEFSNDDQVTKTQPDGRNITFSKKSCLHDVVAHHLDSLRPRDGFQTRYEGETAQWYGWKILRQDLRDFRAMRIPYATGKPFPAVLIGGKPGAIFELRQSGDLLNKVFMPKVKMLQQQEAFNEMWDLSGDRDPNLPPVDYDSPTYLNLVHRCRNASSYAAPKAKFGVQKH
eukprot:jgi/Bigna1/75250/fgenesh1_pg.33_\